MELPSPYRGRQGSEAFRSKERNRPPRTFEDAYRTFVTEQKISFRELVRATVTVEGAATTVQPREIELSSPEEMRRKLQETLHELVVVFEHSSLPIAPQPNQLLQIQLYRQDGTALPLLTIHRRGAP